MFYHLVEVATSWEVVVKGHGDDAMPIASAKDSIEAAKVLFAYDMGKPIESFEVNNPDGAFAGKGAPLTTSEIRARLEFLLLGAAILPPSKADDGPTGETAKPPTAE